MAPAIWQPQLEHSPASHGALRALLGVVDLLKTVFTPQVVAVLLAVGISFSGLKHGMGQGLVNAMVNIYG